MLRLFLDRSTALETIPASPTTTTFSSHDEHTGFTLHVPPDVQRVLVSAPPSPPAFTIPVPSRRQKMDRLRRTFGEDVPVGMVFPVDEDEDKEEEEEEEDKNKNQAVVAVVPSLPFTPNRVTPRTARKTRTGITAARDSMLVSRARRRGGVEAEELEVDLGVDFEMEMDFEPSYPPSAPSGSQHERLSVIAESPDEGRRSGFFDA